MKNNKWAIIDLWHRLTTTIITIASIIALYNNDITIIEPALFGSVVSLLPCFLLNMLYDWYKGWL